MKRWLVGRALATVGLQAPKVAALLADQLPDITPEYELVPEHLVEERGPLLLTGATRWWRLPRHTGGRFWSIGGRGI